MKISEMTTAQAAKALCKIVAPAENIMKDEKIIPSIQRLMNAEKDEMMLVVLMRDIVPLLLDTHFKDFCGVVGALTDKTGKQVENQNVLVTIKDVRDSVDKELFDFLKSSGIARKTRDGESAFSSSDTNTTEPMLSLV